MSTLARVCGVHAQQLDDDLCCPAGHMASRWRVVDLRTGRVIDDGADLSRSEASKAAWADPAVRARMSAARKAALADPAVRARMSAASKAAWADPAVRARMSAASKAAWADPAVRARMSAARKAAWALRKGG